MAYDFVIDISDETAGIGTITLNSSPYAIVNWNKGIAEGDLRDPEALVMDTLEVRLMDSTAANNLDELRTLNLFLRQAETDTDNKVYLRFKESASGSIWRSPIVRGAAYWEDAVINYPQWTTATQKASLYVYRKNYWEGPESQLPITNANGTANTDGLRVYNDSAGTGMPPANFVNYFDVAGTAIVGDIPAATRLEMVYGKTGTDAASNLKYMWIAQSYHSPTSFGHYYNIDTGGSGTAVPSGSTGATIGTITVTADTLNAAKGQMVKCMYRSNYGLGVTGVERAFQVILKSAGITVYEGPIMRVNTRLDSYALWDIASIRMPPVPYTFGSLDALTLEIHGYQYSGADYNVTASDFWLMPLDGFRHFKLMKSVATGERVVDDGINNKLYQDNGSGANRLAANSTLGESIKLCPGRGTNRIYILSHTDGAGYPGFRNYFTTKLYYRPRRLSL